MENEPGTGTVTEGEGAESEAAAQLLHHVLFMANPIHLKQSKSALLSLKQRHPELFRSPCVYSDVCALLARDTYNMLPTRRFLQELFLDTNFDCFLTEPELMLSRHTTTPLAVPTVALPNVESQ